jgi:hypothetical protein
MVFLYNNDIYINWKILENWLNNSPYCLVASKCSDLTNKVEDGVLGL